MEFYFEYRQKDHEKAYEKENKMYSFKKKKLKFQFIITFLMLLNLDLHEELNRSPQLVQLFHRVLDFVVVPMFIVKFLVQNQSSLVLLCSYISMVVQFESMDPIPMVE